MHACERSKHAWKGPFGCILHSIPNLDLLFCQYGDILAPPPEVVTLVPQVKKYDYANPDEWPPVHSSQNVDPQNFIFFTNPDPLSSYSVSPVKTTTHDNMVRGMQQCPKHLLSTWERTLSRAAVDWSEPDSMQQVLIERILGCPASSSEFFCAASAKNADPSTSLYDMRLALL